MATFNYIVKDSAGQRIEGALKAASVESALDNLKRKGLTVISVKEARSDILGAKQSIVDQVAASLYRMRTRVPLKIVVFFTRQISTMFSAGLTIEKSVSNLLHEEKNPRFRKVLARVANDIKKGLALSEALAKHPGVFNNLFVALVHAGEISGSLHIVLEQLADYLETVAETRRKVISAMSYPAFVLVFMIGIIALLLLFVIPQFTEIYDKFGANLPGPTRVLVGVSQLISQNFITVFFLSVLGLSVLWVLSLTERGGYIFDTLKLQIPIMGMLVKNSIMNRFAKTFGILIGAGVPVLESIDLVQKVVGNKVVERGLNLVKSLVKDGFSISVAMKKSLVFPPTLIQLVSTGEETGEMDKLLNKAAYFYEKQVDSIVDRLTSLIEPLLIVSIGSVIAVIIITVYLPVFQLGMALRQGL
ncbi:type II secretion system F family protein [bacterium]|nr:type II secretion system F family protein [FCB group bacterium]MBL7191993.1 type II secretion system F family protein [bacterium]